MRAVNSALADLARLGMVSEITGKRRDRVWSYDRYVALLTAGATLPRAESSGAAP
jgi:hypothetical protein